MRISSSLLFQTGLNSINAQQSDLMHLFQQIGSGQRMVTPADDPLAAAQSINIRQSQSMNLRYAENRQVAQSSLGIAENTLSSVVDLTVDIKTRLIEAGNGTLSDVDRTTLSNVLKHARTNLLGLANATDGNGQYLFSGSKGDIKPFSDDGVYDGDDSQRLIQVDQTRRMAVSDTGTDIFSRATPGSARYLTAVDAPAGNAGTAVIGGVSVYDASLLQPGYQFAIEFSDASTYSISVFDDQGNLVTYDADEHGDVGDWTGSKTFNPGVENSIQLPFGVQVNVSGNPSGERFTVSPAASQDLNMFNTLDALIAVLEQPLEGNPGAQAHFQNVLASSIQRLDINYDNILTVRSSVGARFNELEALDANGNLRNLGYRNDLTQLEDLDYYTAATQLELRKTALEAATLAFRKIQNTSLFAIGSGR